MNATRREGNNEHTEHDMNKRQIITIAHDAKRRACAGEISLAKLSEIKASLLKACAAKGYKTPKELLP